ncbi:MAG: hypothetical protein AAB935_02190 [Patescibacteria group bacterium]
MKKVLVFIPILIIAVVVIGAILKGNKPAENLTEENGVKKEDKVFQKIKGVSLSPRSFTSEDFTDFFEKAKEAGNIVSWAGDWNELSNTQGGGPTVVATLSSQYKYIPVIETQFFTQSTGKLLRPLDANTKENYRKLAVDFAQKFKPKYLGFGIEINTLYEKSPADFEKFTEFYNEVYDAVKAVSPNTKLFTIFQLEKMKGLSGGLFGNVNDPLKSQWSLPQKFKSDLIAFTTYPDLIYKNPSEIPQNYYKEINAFVSKPIAFTEIGWHSAASPTGWESGEAEQAEFVKVFFDLTKELKPEFFIWSFLYDQDAIRPFNSMGFFNNEGKAKLAWNEWISLK